MKKTVDEAGNHSATPEINLLPYYNRINKLQNPALAKAVTDALQTIDREHKIIPANEIDTKEDEIETLIAYAEKPLDERRANKFNLVLKKYCENSYSLLHELGQMLVIVGILAIFVSLILLAATIPAVASTLLISSIVDTLLIAAVITGSLGKGAISLGFAMTFWARPEDKGRALLEVREELVPGSYEFDPCGQEAIFSI